MSACVRACVCVCVCVWGEWVCKVITVGERGHTYSASSSHDHPPSNPVRFTLHQHSGWLAHPNPSSDDGVSTTHPSHNSPGLPVLDREKITNIQE
jgi:hypothetical protein